MQAKRGFTLVEILIVVVILGILAAIVIPQFTQASTEAKTNSLASSLQTLRSQIELYKCQHNDTAPTPLGDDPETWPQMTLTTDIDGNPSTDKARTAVFVYGPYLERVPANPFNNLNTILVVAGSTKPAAADDTTGWVYLQGTGEIYANNLGATTTGIAYFEF
jgi:general secretion pathway protein G